ncbi:MAG: GIY-YIG nuclease family protein [Chloroflexota bacterium]|jgi:putative endonuclease|nr:GIY-YIG nuclease family protein [Chloroflexota bacterium]
MSYYCYMVRCSNGAYYTGWTTDPLRRVKEHNAGRGARYTRMNGPVRLVYVEEVEDHSAALKREIEIKQYNHERKANLAKRESLAQGFNTETSEKE